MRPLIPSYCLSALLLVGCATPQKIKDVQTSLLTETPKFKEAHLSDLAATEAYVRQTKTSLDALVAEANLRAVNIQEAAAAWRGARVSAFRAQILGGFDAEALKAIDRCLHEKSREFDESINVTLRPLVEDQVRKQKAYQQNTASGSLRDDYEAAALRTTLLHDSANAVFLKQLKALVEGLASERTKLEKEIDDAFAAAGGAAAKPAADQIVFTKALTADQLKSAYDPADALKQIAERREAISAASGGLTTDLKSVKYYLDTDGYSRLFVKDAVAGAAEAVKSSVAGPVKDFLTDKVKLPGDVAANLTGKALDGVLQSAQDSLFGIFTALQKKAGAVPGQLLQTFESELKARETELLAKTLKT